MYTYIVRVRVCVCGVIINRIYIGNWILKDNYVNVENEGSGKNVGEKKRCISQNHPTP